jgi:hypothetical protein
MIRCDICDCNITVTNKKSIILPYSGKYTTSICLCETCYYRFPYDLQYDINKIAANQSDRDFAKFLISSLKGLGRSDLNSGIWIWFRDENNGEGKFRKCSSNRAIIEEIMSVKPGVIYTVYRNGKAIDTSEIKEATKKYRKWVRDIDKRIAFSH